MTQTKPKTLEPGYYTLVYRTGEWRSLRVSVVDEGPLQGRIILSYKDGTEYVGFAFLNPDGTIYFWKSFVKEHRFDQKRLERLRRAVEIISSNPTESQQMFAMKESCCWRCGRTLTVPASVHQGLGPECAKIVGGERKTNQQVFDSMKEQVTGR